MSEIIEREWPLVITGGSKILHISRQNVRGEGMRTECGRTIKHNRTEHFSDEEFEASDGVTIEHDWWPHPYKFCTRCGTKEDFQEAEKTFQKLKSERTEQMQQELEDKKKRLETLQIAVRACMASEVLYGITGVDDVVNEDWSILFTLNGKRYRLTAEEPPDVED